MLAKDYKLAMQVKTEAKEKLLKLRTAVNGTVSRLKADHSTFNGDAPLLTLSAYNEYIGTHDRVSRKKLCVDFRITPVQLLEFECQHSLSYTGTLYAMSPEEYRWLYDRCQTRDEMLNLLNIQWVSKEDYLCKLETQANSEAIEPSYLYG